MNDSLSALKLFRMSVINAPSALIMFIYTVYISVLSVFCVFVYFYSLLSICLENHNEMENNKLCGILVVKGVPYFRIEEKQNID